MEGEVMTVWKRLERGVPRMHRGKRLRVSEVNPHVICVLCGGYYIDATTITECLHTFCKTCIVGYLEASKHCPVCDNLVHKTKPHLRLRPDHTLQDLVYKLVPGLFQDEMKKRREFYKEEIQHGKLGDTGIPEERERIIYSADEQISLVLELSSDGQPPINPGTRVSKHKVEAADRRYLQCPANITISHLKKFIRMKFNLCDRYQVDFYHTDESLHDHYSLVDVAYIYSWRRQGPLRLYYTIFTNPAKKFKADIENLVPMETDVLDKSDSSRAETSGYLSSDDLDKSHDRSRDSGVSLGESFVISERKSSSCSESLDDSGVALDCAQNDTVEVIDVKLDKTSEGKIEPKPADSGNKIKPAESGNKTKAIDSGNKTKPVDCGNKTKPVEIKYKTKPADSKSKTKSAESKTKTKPADSKSKTKPVDSANKTKPADSGNKTKPVECRSKTSIVESDNEKVHSKNEEYLKESVSDIEMKENIKDEEETGARNQTIPVCLTQEETVDVVKQADTVCEITDKPFREPEKYVQVMPDSVIQKESDSKPVETIIPDIECDSENVESATSTEYDSINKATKSDKQREPLPVKRDNDRETATRKTAETSTCTSPIPMKDVHDKVTVTKQKAKVSDDDVSEPVVSSTQNTQGCQTEPPESCTDTLELPHSSEAEEQSKPVCQKSTVDVSCGTDSFVLSREVSVESVSVSTETEHAEADSKGKVSKDCSTDVCDFPDAGKERRTVDCSTDFEGFPDNSNKRNCSTDFEGFPGNSNKRNCSTDFEGFPGISITRNCSTDFEGLPENSNKRKALSVDCSTGTEDFEISSSKRKSVDSATVTESKSAKESKKSDIKTTKRSFSYSGYTSTQKTAYLAQPLSPTKITLKFTPPKSPIKTLPKAQVNSRAEPTGFQSQYQSFVMELPNKTYEFHDDAPNPTTSEKSTGPVYKHANYTSSPNLLASAPKKVQTKTGRPRGRPPKNRPVEIYEEPPQKEKKHKSRSHSPKHRRHSEKGSDSHKDKYSVSVGEKRKHTHSPSKDNAKQTSTPYSWINKIDTGPKHSSERKLQKSKSDSGAKPSSELKIPKQFLFFSNGQYTLASESTLAALKQSSPVSPTRTVSVADSKPSSYGDKHNNNNTSSSNNNTNNYTSATDKPKEKKTTPVVKTEAPKVFAKTESKTSTHTAVTKTSSITSKAYVQSDIKTDSSQKSEGRNLVGVGVCKTPTPTKTQSSPVASSRPEPKDDRKTTSPAKSLEYRHQSPFFTSISGAKLNQTHRFGTHLNIPNLSSHFSGTHHLYAHARYSAERLAQPSNLYRSFSMTEKCPTSPIVTKFQDSKIQRMDSVPSPCGYLTPFPTAYLGLPHMHSHVISSLPPAASPKGYSPDSTRSPTNAVSDQNTSIGNSPSHTSSAKNVIKSPGLCRKGKEKSIDNIITAITEMRAKKEEQLNGIDLSTKSSRQTDKSSSSNNGERLDKYAFTDEDDVRVTPSKSIYKTEHVPVQGHR